MANFLGDFVVSDNEIKRKMKFSGKVIKTSLAGAVVDIGAKQPAVLHISQLPHDTNEDAPLRVEDVLQIGQTVDVWVKRVKDDHIELTMIKPLDLEWREIKPGMVVKGKVVRLEKFGVFVEIGAERPGLIHISELAHGYVRTPSEVVNEGDEVEAEVLDVQRKKKQIKLSMKALQPEPIVEKPKTAPAEAHRPRERPARKKKERKPRERVQGGSEILLTFADASLPEGESEPTAMEIALREAMERAKTRKKEKEQEDKSKKPKSTSEEQEEILSRTLENKVQTS
jgi:small subunit ribosomal protein S1